MPDNMEQQQGWYALTTKATAERLQVDPAKGLSSTEAAKRREQYGANALTAKKQETGWQRFLRQYQDFMQILLVVAAVVSYVATREWATTIVILVLTVLNAVLGLHQESKAEASLNALQSMMKNIARVRRDGQTAEIDAEELVPGDIVLMEAGNRVPADGRLFVAATLEIEEAALTGESVASPKDVAVIDKSDVALGDRVNMAFMNTAVTRGRGEMIVTTTGMGTEMGHIADLLNKTESEKTPLQKQLDRLVLIIAGIAGITFLAMIALGLNQGQSFNEIFIAGIALAIAGIPTGLPVVVTALYSMGTRTLADQNAIVKRLPSVETLGSVSAICSDKTGTLTLNQMTAVEFSIPGQNRYRVSGEGYSTAGQLELSRIPAGEPWQKGGAPYTTEGQIKSAGGANIDLEPIMLPMALCADARLDGENLIGDPTEGALIVLAEKGGISVDDARDLYPRIAEVPFDSDYKFMATFHNMTNEAGEAVVRCFVKGAPDVLIARGGSFYAPGGKSTPVNEETRALALKENERMAQAGERVMVVARRDFDPKTFDPAGKLIDLVKDLVLIAMVGIVDPPRPEAKVAIAKCHSAGIQVRMITGDHAVTAAAIGKQLGIEGKALTGAQFSAMSDEQLMKEIPEIGVVARVAPEDKIRLVDLLQRQENIVAMTGDGVNDAPALKKADIGVAMGITGTEVSKDAAVMILTDDNFSTIVRAVETGRAIYDNLVKYINFQMVTLVGFIACFLGAALFLIAGGVPFGPLVILAVNFFCHAPISIALGLDAPAPDLMERTPRPLKQPVLSRGQWLRIVFVGLHMAVVTLVAQNFFSDADPTTVNSVGYITFILASIVLGISARDETRSCFRRDFLGSGRQIWLYVLPLVIAFLLTELGPFQRIFDLAHLNGEHWMQALGLALTVLVTEEVIKFFLRRHRRNAALPSTPVVTPVPARA